LLDGRNKAAGIEEDDAKQNIVNLLKKKSEAK